MLLLIDSYDSFTNNLSSLIHKTTGKQVVVIHNDSVDPQNYNQFLAQYLHLIEYIIIGPGPGSPQNPSDVGMIDWLFQHFIENPDTAVPIFGICLGFQCLCYNFGNEVQKLDDVKHGQVYDVVPVVEQEPLFEGQFDKKLPSVRYHSLFVEISSLNSEIVPLALCYEQSKKVLMAAKHKSLPFYGVQYHPESICTEGGDVLVANFDKIAKAYNDEHRRDFDGKDDEHLISALKTNTEEKPLVEGTYTSHHDDLFVSVNEIKFKSSKSSIEVCDLLVDHLGQPDFILLNSASVPGNWSIIGLPEANRSEVITHSVDEINQVLVSKHNTEESTVIELDAHSTVWNVVAERFARNYVSRERILSQIPSEFHRSFPFLGGYLGLISYEEGKHVVIEKIGKICKGAAPDLKLVFVERFLLFDHTTGQWFAMSVSQTRDDSDWCKDITSTLEEYDTPYTPANIPITPSIKSLLKEGEEVKVEFPDEEIYKEQFRLCQQYLHDGDSYELCLTTPSKIYLPSHVKSWELYKILAHKNPAPFSCFMDFGDVTLLSSSPERFLDWKGIQQKTVELRPIKGTVKNTSDMTLEKATEILKTPKEMGENLMIVDLIRHDLHQFIPNIEVSQLMTVEEYKTVFQLVSYIKGTLENEKYHGIDILHSSLPPGSMTGAPKKRSVELLQSIEELQPNAIRGGRRGVYSGVVGYWSITDDSDWSVVIRSMFHYKDDLENSDTNSLWRIGAGGAITVLSDCNGEWEEMELKLASAFQVFQ